MKKGKRAFVTDTIDCGPAAPTIAATVQETAFEKGRGVSSIEIRRGFTQAHVLGLSEPIHDNRLHVLEAIADAGISLDFLKLTQDGLSFLVPDSIGPTLEPTLDRLEVAHTLKPGHDIVLVHAVNMRDEEGLISRVLSQAIQSGVKVEHVGDMHDRVLMVVESQLSDALRDTLLTVLTGGVS